MFGCCKNYITVEIPREYAACLTQEQKDAWLYNRLMMLEKRSLNITADATVDNTTGTPEVEVVKSGTETDTNFLFNFTGIKGEQGIQGEQGPQGDPGPLGPRGLRGYRGYTGETPNIMVNATVDNTTGTPAVEVVKSGTETYPNFMFNFTGLKGEAGGAGGASPIEAYKVFGTVSVNENIAFTNIEGTTVVKNLLTATRFDTIGFKIPNDDRVYCLPKYQYVEFSDKTSYATIVNFEFYDSPTSGVAHYFLMFTALRGLTASYHVLLNSNVIRTAAHGLEIIK